MSTIPVLRLCGVPVHNVTMDQTMRLMEEFILRRTPCYIVTPNADHIVKLQTDAEFMSVYEGAALSLADGMALLWAGRFLGTSIREKVSGSDLMPEFCRYASKKGHRIFFLGGREGAAMKAKEVLEAECPGIRIVGTYCPPMGFEKDPAESERIIRIVREASPDVLFVGLGSPKQEKWIRKNHQTLRVPVSVGIGATFEFVSGFVRRAPVWVQRIGLEWLWRLLQEPKRLWRRYLVDDMVFFRLVFQQKIHKRS